MTSIRHFAMISYLIIAVFFITSVWYGRNYVENKIIRAMAEKEAKVASSIFTQVIWRKHQDILPRLPCTPRDCPDSGELAKDMTLFFAIFPHLSCKLYTPDGLGVLDGKKFQTNQSVGAFETLFILAGQGRAVSSQVFEYGANGQHFTAVRVLVPITPGGAEADRRHIPAVLEVVYDVTDAWYRPGYYQVVLIGGFLGALLLVFGVILYFTYRVEKLATEQYETNIDLVSAKTSAERESREKSQFLANVSHELRTPLNAIIGFSEIIKDEVMGPLNNQQYKDYIADIHASGVHLLSLINDILDFSKAEAGKLTVDLTDVDVTKVMTNSLRLVMPRAHEAQISLVSKVPKEHYILKIDGKRLKQVLLNLLSNAVKFTPAGGTVTLYAWHNVNNNTFVIEVQDTGVGIAPKDLTKVMETFGQVEGRLSRRFEGTGLGLPLSRRLVDLMGGQLEIQSELDKGTTVSVIFPYTPDIAEPEASAREMDEKQG